MVTFSTEGFVEMRIGNGGEKVTKKVNSQCFKLHFTFYYSVVVVQRQQNSVQKSMIRVKRCFFVIICIVLVATFVVVVSQAPQY